MTADDCDCIVASSNVVTGQKSTSLHVFVLPNALSLLESLKPIKIV